MRIAFFRKWPKNSVETIQVLYHGDSPRELSAATATHLESVPRIPCLVSFTLASSSPWHPGGPPATGRPCTDPVSVGVHVQWIMYSGGLWGYVLDIVHWGAVGDKTGGAVGIR